MYPPPHKLLLVCVLSAALSALGQGGREAAPGLFIKKLSPSTGTLRQKMSLVRVDDATGRILRPSDAGYTDVDSLKNRDRETHTLVLGGTSADGAEETVWRTVFEHTSRYAKGMSALDKVLVLDAAPHRGGLLVLYLKRNEMFLDRVVKHEANWETVSSLRVGDKRFVGALPKVELGVGLTVTSTGTGAQWSWLLRDDQLIEIPGTDKTPD